MVTRQYVTIQESDFGGGIDQQSAENRIQEGYVESLTNADPQPTGHVTKRTGYQGFAGNIPVRIKEIAYTDASENNILLVFDTSIQVPVAHSQPLILMGKTSSANIANVGDFPNNMTSIHYYPGFTSDIRKNIFTGVNNISIPQTEHGFSSPYLFVGVAQSVNSVNYSNTQVYANSVAINEASFDVNVGVDNLTGESFEAFFYIKDKATVPGQTYVSTGHTAASGAITAISVPASSHVLSSGNIIVKAYESAAGIMTELAPEYVYINSSTDVTVGINNITGSSISVTVILSVAPTANFTTGAVAAGQTSSVIISTNVSGGSNFAFVACYFEAGTTLQQVLPDSITTNADTGIITVTFTNNMSTGATFELFWEFVDISTNSITITGSTIGAGDEFNDFAPQLTLYGLDHAEIYGEKIPREGWTNHIDSYKSAGENRLIAGLGGNLFAARLREESTNATDYLLPLAYPSINVRLDMDSILGPAFYNTGDLSDRTRGFITGDNGGENFFTISSVAYNTGTGWIDYTLTIPNMVITGTLSTIISTVTGLEDYFTAQQCAYADHNGVFKIRAVASPDSETLVISVENPLIFTSDFDTVDMAGDGGIFTDQLVFASVSPFLTGDTLGSDLFTNTINYTVVNTVNNISVVSGATELLGIPNGLRITGTRTSRIIPLRQFGGTPDVINFLRGDMLTYTGIARQLRIKQVNALDDAAVTISGDGTTATATLTSELTNNLVPGVGVLITGTVNYNGVQTVTEILNDTQFTFDSTALTTEAGVITGKTIEVDEELTFSDTPNSSNSFTVHSRWIPIEIPEDAYTGTPKTIVTHFDSNSYDSQEILRSTMVSDNLYLTNGDDEVLKFDGTNIYRAGLPRWPLQLFLTSDTTATGKIVTGNPVVTTTAASSNNRFTIPEADQNIFVVGDTIKDSTDGQTYVIKVISVVSPSTLVSVDRIITGGTNGQTITRVRAYKYYARLNAIDANNNIIASAVTGAEDNVILLGSDAAVYLRGVGLPAWDIYDYDRLEAEIYRTKGDGQIYYRLTTIPLSFDLNTGYFDYVDTDADTDLRDLDEVNTALKGSELGTAWTEPVRAKYITSAGNKLILGNLKDYPELNLQILKKTTLLTQSVFTATDNRRWLFRKDNTDNLTTSNMVDRAGYCFTATSSALTISAITLPTSTSFQVATAAPHGLAIGNWVYLFRDVVTNAQQLTFAGWFQVETVPTSSTVTFANGNNPASVTGVHVNRLLVASSGATDVPVPIGTDGNYAQFNGNRTSTDPYEFVAVRRMADAINASMRKSTNTGFAPWMIAAAGNEFTTGQLVVRQPKVFQTNLELLIPVLTGALEIYVNGVRRVGNGQAGAIARLFPSRIIVSYNNYPEIFDAPTATIDTESDSAIDINPADGQEITAVIPFFGDAAFGAAQKSGIVVVFKTNSIYVVDLAAKDSGTNAVQKLETMNKGCTAPYSVSVTKSGIMFANDTGIYRLSNNLDVEFIGRRYDRIFNSEVNKEQISILTGHHDSQANSYKLSYPLVGETENSSVAVYNHTREYEKKGDGSWTTYDSHSVTGWANLTANSYFASTAGRVFVVRRLGLTSDFRDDSAPISMEMLVRALDAGDAGRRKVFNCVITHFRIPANSSGTVLETAVDLSNTFQPTDNFVLIGSQSDGLGGTEIFKILPINHSISEKMGVYLQLRYTNSSLDEPVEITGIDVRVAGLNDKGIRQAASTK